MAVTQYPFTGDGSTRIFPIAVKIISEDYVKIEVDTVPFLDTTAFDIINNSVVFKLAPVNLSAIVIWVADSIESIANLGTTTNVDLVGINMADINIIANNIEDIKTASSDLVKWTEPFIATAGQTAFISTHVVDKVSVYVNGLRLTYPTDYTTLAKTVTLTTPAEVGDEVMLEGGQATSALPNYVAVTLNTIAEMLAYDPTVANTVIVKNENQGGIFVYDATLIATNNGGTIFNGWVRQYSGAVNVKWFGASESATASTNSLAITNAIINEKSIFIPKGTYVTNEILINGVDGISINGEGSDSVLQLNNSTNRSVIRILNSDSPYISNIRLIGTSDSISTYESADLREGIYLSGCTFPTIINNTFSKFASHCIEATLLTGGTYTDGMFIQNNIFEDCPYDPLTTLQACIYMSEDSEYSTITGNQFRRSAKAIKGKTANVFFGHNIIMNMSGQQPSRSLNMPIFEWDAGTGNSGKLIIHGNQFNHNDEQIAIVISGDVTKPQNAVTISDNHIVANTTDNDTMEMVVLVNSPRARITNNLIRTSGLFSTFVINLNGCDNSYLDGNDLQGGTYGIQILDSLECKFGIGNHFTGQSVGRVVLAGTSSTIKNYNNLLNLQVTSNITGAIWDATSGENGFPSTWTLTHVATGRYQIVHNMNTQKYSCVVSVEKAYTANPLIPMVVHNTNGIDISFKNLTGTLTDTDFMALVTLSQNNTYGL